MNSVPSSWISLFSFHFNGSHIFISQNFIWSSTANTASLPQSSLRTSIPKILLSYQWLFCHTYYKIIVKIKIMSLFSNCRSLKTSIVLCSTVFYSKLFKDCMCIVSHRTPYFQLVKFRKYKSPLHKTYVCNTKTWKTHSTA